MKIRQSFKEKLRILAKLFRDPATPLWMKIVIIVCIVYVIWPLDILPDFIPIPLLGLIDDIIVILIVAYGLASTEQGKKRSTTLQKPWHKTIIEGK